jgi:hypothetical protein
MRRTCPRLHAGIACAVWLWVITGCTTPQADASATAAAVILIENHSDYPWRIAFRPAGSVGEPDWMQIAPREKHRVELAGGRYLVSRVLISADAGPSADDAQLTLIGGHTYSWPLGTLFSAERIE